MYVCLCVCMYVCMYSFCSSREERHLPTTERVNYKSNQIKSPEIIYTGSEETHVGHECFGYLSLRSDLITIT